MHGLSDAVNVWGRDAIIHTFHVGGRTGVDVSVGVGVGCGDVLFAESPSSFFGFLAVL